MLRDFAGPSMLLVRHRLGSPKDPKGSVGLFCFWGSKIAADAVAFSAIGLIWTIFGTEQRASARTDSRART
jgi:hypothetical protein